MLVSFSVSRIFRSFSSIGVLGLLVLAQLGADTGQQDRELERLGHVVVGAGVEPEDGIGVAVMTGEHQNRAFDALLAHQPAQLAAVRIGEPDVQDHEVE